MTIQNIDIHKIIPYKNNPRKNDNAVDKVAESIQLFGFKNPIIIDKNNVIVCGHTRVKAAVKLELKTVPCIYADDLTDEQVKAFRLIDNKTAEYAEWDFEKLSIELENLNENIDFDLSDFDFNIQNMEFPSFNELEKEKSVSEDEKVIVKITFSNYKDYENKIDKIRNFIAPMGLVVSVK